MIFQWDAKSMNLQITHTKSILLSTSIRRQSPVHREAFGVSSLVAMENITYFRALHWLISYLMMLVVSLT